MATSTDPIIRFAKRVIRAGIRRLTPAPDAFLKKVKGVIHVGANVGQERDSYAKLGLNVVWVEPIPEIFRRLESNIAGYPLQRAFKYLVTDQDGGEYEFNIASNGGASSSILDLDLHDQLWPDVSFTGKIKVPSITLDTLIRTEQLDLTHHDALVLDTQGSELTVLRGAVEFLPDFKYIKTEAADFHAYRDCCLVSEIDEFLTDRGFELVNKHRFTSKRNVGSYYDVVYRRRLA